jgi:putative FmdB family regulatory protein
MPIYEYTCEGCNHHLEALQKLSEEPLVYCPECGEAALRKKVSAAAFRLKGSGWYETDFKDSGKEKGKSKPDDVDKAGDKSSSDTSVSGDGKSGSKSDGKSDGKSAATTESKPAAKISASGNKSGGDATTGTD